jgi:hypothetical protein
MGSNLYTLLSSGRRASAGERDEGALHVCLAQRFRQSSEKFPGIPAARPDAQGCFDSGLRPRSA